MPLNYATGKIYAIRSYSTDKIYIGSTIQTLSERMSGHRAAYKKFLKTQDKYISSFEILKYDDCYIELIKNYSCNSKEELLREEGIEIRKSNCVNMIVAGRTSAEWSQDNRGKKREIDKRYRENHKDLITERRKTYRETNREKVREANKKWKRSTVKCEICNTILQKHSFSYHKKTKKHIDMYNNKQPDGCGKLAVEKIRCECCQVEILKTSLKTHLKSKKHQENEKKEEENEEEESLDKSEYQSESSDSSEYQSESDESSVDQTESSSDSQSESSDD